MFRRKTSTSAQRTRLFRHSRAKGMGQKNLVEEEAWGTSRSIRMRTCARDHCKGNGDQTAIFVPIDLLENCPNLPSPVRNSYHLRYRLPLLSWLQSLSEIASTFCSHAHLTTALGAWPRRTAYCILFRSLKSADYQSSSATSASINGARSALGLDSPLSQFALTCTYVHVACCYRRESAANH